MELPKDDELRLLQERAYGRSPDIIDDREAVERLGALERELVERRVDAPASAPPGRDPAPHSEPLPSLLASPPSPSRRPSRTSSLGVSVALAFRWVLSSRRRTLMVMWAATLVVALVVSGTALALVERLHAAPLVPEAAQVARLSVQPSADVPDAFDDGQSAAVGFEDYLGLEVVLLGYVTETADRCLVVYDTASVTFTGNGYSAGGVGVGLWQACGAGVVPPAVQFLVTRNSVPQNLRDDPGVGVTVQFVYDDAANEVIVFETSEQ